MYIDSNTITNVTGIILNGMNDGGMDLTKTFLHLVQYPNIFTQSKYDTRAQAESAFAALQAAVATRTLAYYYITGDNKHSFVYYDTAAPGAGNLFVNPENLEGVATPAVDASETRFVNTVDNFQGTTDAVEFIYDAVYGAHMGLVDLGDPVRSTGDGERNAASVFSDEVKRSFPEAYRMQTSYGITNGDATQGKTVYVGPDGIGYNNYTAFSGRGFAQRRDTDLILSNRRWGAAWNPNLGYPRSVAVAEGSLWFGGHKDPRFSNTIWKSRVDNFFDFGTHFRKFTEDDSETPLPKDESEEQNNARIADRLPTYGIVLDVAVRGGISSMITEGSNIILAAREALHDFIALPLAGDDNAGTRRLGFVDLAVVNPSAWAIADDSLFVYDSFGGAAVKAQINLSELTETRYKPVRISQVKDYQRLGNVRTIYSARSPNTTATLLFFLNDDGKASVFHSVTDGGQDVLAAWGLWELPGDREWGAFWQAGNTIGAIAADSGNFLLGNMDFDLTGDIFDGETLTDFVGRATLPELLVEATPGYGTRYPIALAEVLVDADNTDLFNAILLPDGDATLRRNYISARNNAPRSGRLHFAGAGDSEAIVSTEYHNALTLEQTQAGKFNILNVQMVAAVDERETGATARRDLRA